jgi:pimeloyl-ACP methyl ester carboxylesterase
METVAEAPEWFRTAVTTPFDQRTVEVDGCAVNYLRWGDPALPGLVLVHGGAAHAHWWSFLAPLLTGAYHVVAVDLSGHGDSGRRPVYDAETWAAELLAVAADAAMRGKPILVGHSMGGFVSMVAASLYGDRLAGAVIVDSPVRRSDPESEEAASGRAFRTTRVYPDLAAALRRFRLVPPQPVEHAYLVDHVARHSLRAVDGGWTWKFDPAIFQRFSPRQFHDYLAGVRCRVAVFHGEFSDLVTPEVSEYMSELLGRNAPFVEIPQAHHHLLLDQPLAFVAALRAILADWEHSLPRVEPPWALPGTPAHRLWSDVSG